MEFDLRESSQGSIHVVSVTGDLDICTAPLLDSHLQRTISAGKRDIALDMENCSYLDSEGIKVLIKALRALSGRGRMLICGARGAVTRVLEISGLDAVFEILPSMEDLVSRHPLVLLACLGCLSWVVGCCHAD